MRVRPLAPSAICAQTIALARRRRLYFGAYDPKGHDVEHGACIFRQATCHHRPEVFGGVEVTRCGELTQDTFQARW